MKTISWETFRGNSLPVDEFSEKELQTLHNLFKEAHTEGSEIDYDRFLQRVAGSTVLICSDEQEITTLGVYNYQPYTKESYVRIDALAVYEVYRGQGLGSFVLHQIVNEAKLLECETIRLQSRKSAVSFYRSHGFGFEYSIEANSPYVPMRLNLSRVPLSEETTLRTPLKSV